MLRVYEAAMAEGEAEGRQKEKEGKVWEVVFETWEGEEVRRQGRDGESVMELGKREDLGAMEGVCGGVLEVRPLLPLPALLEWHWKLTLRRIRAWG
jgi:hypothetical protein